MATSPQMDGFDPTPTHQPYSVHQPSQPMSSASGRSTPRAGLGSSRPGSIRAASTAFHMPTVGSTKYFRSRRIRDTATISKPWTEVPDKGKKWHVIFPWIGVAIGFAVVALECYTAYVAVPNFKYCPVYEVDFGAGGQLDPSIWTRELSVGGFGNGEFDQTTDSEENAFIKDGELWIKPTLQDEKLITENTVLDITEDGCQSDVWTRCHAVTNTTNGTIVPPVRSARLSTKKGMSIQYGRVEVVASLPAGDWMWPAIWMLPVEDKYGAWPASGEIDIVESRGNNHSYRYGGNNVMSSALHWGPSESQDAWQKTYSGVDSSHTTFTKTYFKFGLEWSEKYLYTYINSRLKQVMYTPFTKARWPQGNFDTSQPITANGTMPVDPWSQTGRPSTPFDIDYYLILNVAVGGTNGWFYDGVDGKPWVDASSTAKRDFWNARDQWYPTWEENGQMRIKSIKVSQQTGYRGCNA